VRIRHKPGDTRPRAEEGYVLLALLLIFALIAITGGLAASTLAFQIKRDHEEELIHRGVQYSRAIRKFTKQKGRYPNTVDELLGAEGTNRYLRKRYSDPVTKGNFRWLSVADVMRAAGLSSSGAPLNSQVNPSNDSPVGAPRAGGIFSGGAFSSTSAQTGQTGNPQNTTDSGANSSQNPPNSSSNNPDQDGSNSSIGYDAANGTIVPGGIAGVVSASKDRTIREFSHKNHYNQWLFFYQPAFDTGMEIKGPTQLTTASSVQPQPGQPVNQPGVPFQQAPNLQSNPPQSNPQLPGQNQFQQQ
jgi:type II secretory pathway pseudopilin PulG